MIIPTKEGRLIEKGSASMGAEGEVGEGKPLNGSYAYVPPTSQEL